MAGQQPAGGHPAPALPGPAILLHEEDGIMHRARAANSTWLIVLLSIQACGDDPAAPPPEPSSVAVEPQGTVLRAIGDTVRFRARAVDTDGNVMTTATFNWSVSDAFIASVDAQGLVT
ncbi:MAG TPA: hypothetical protein VK928_11565, partial [Longimicrobiales bacterium]|nr:hypothetical protein [Longimicrobiales bacterium]